MVTTGNIYTAGYQAVYNVLSLEGRETDRANQAVVTVLMEVLAGKLSQDEFFSLAILLEKTGTRLRDLDGNAYVDLWGEMNGASAENCGRGEGDDVRE